MKLFCFALAHLLAAVTKVQSAEAWEPCSTSKELEWFYKPSHHRHQPSACAALERFLPGAVSYPETSAYTESVGSYWSVQEESVRPSCIVSPQSAEEVSIAVSILHRIGQHSPGDAQFAVRSGGHTPWAGAANIKDGVTIDLSSFKKVQLSDDKTTVALGPGNAWVDVYEKLVPQGLATGGGRIASVGVGGLVLGGGVSFFSPLYGFVCDTVKRFEVVLASGEIINATKDSHHDLWLALKGGSNNFGIVTEIEQIAFPQGDFWGGFIGFSDSTFDEQFEAFEALNGNPNYDPHASLIANYVWNQTSSSWFGASSFEYTKPVANPPFFKNFTSLPMTFSTMRISNLTDFTVELAAPNPAGRRELFATGTYSNSAAMLKEIFRLANDTVRDLDQVKTLGYSLSFQPEPPIIQDRTAEQGGNSLGLEGNGPIFNFLLTISWADKVDDVAVDKAARELFVRSESSAKRLGVENRYIYLNYAAPWQDPIHGYGSKVVARLQKVSRKYDPHGTFQKQVPGGFKLFT